MKIKKSHDDTTLDILSSAIHKNYIAHICGDGQIFPIEERIGKKLLKTINPMSKRGRELLTMQKVTFHLPDGRRISSQSLGHVFQRLRESVFAKIQKFPEDEIKKAYLHTIIENIKSWEKFYLG